MPQRKCAEVRYETVLVVIDAQRAFVDPAGSLARTLGMAEVRPGVEAIDRLGLHLAARGAGERAIFVRSEYAPGQFTGSDTDHDIRSLREAPERCIAKAAFKLINGFLLKGLDTC